VSTTLAFAPWTRLGLGAALTAPPGALRAQLTIDAHVGGTIDGAAAPVVGAPPLTAQTLGPGDVLGIDPRVVVRTDPGPYGQAVPAHSLVSIEFSRADFPWLFSPLAPDAQQRLQPWLCLIVVPRRRGISLRSRDSGLQVLAVDNTSELPDLSEAWAWAHSQVITGGNGSGNVSRLVSPRRLDRLTSYYACLVPTFNVGLQVAAHHRVSDGECHLRLPPLSVGSLHVGGLRPGRRHQCFLLRLNDARAGRGRDAGDRIRVQFVQPRRGRNRLRLAVARRRHGACLSRDPP
jgi:hypothetical protein